MSGGGVSVTSGAAMAGGTLWEPQNCTDTIMRLLFPPALAMARSKELFKGWEPPPEPERPAPAPVSFNLSAFTGSPAVPSKRHLGDDDGDEGAASPSLKRVATMWKSAAASARTSVSRADADSVTGVDSSRVSSKGSASAASSSKSGGGAAAQPAVKAAASAFLATKSSAAARRRGRRGDDDDDDD